MIARKAPDKPPLLNPAQRAALAQVIESGPLPAIDGMVRWRLINLAQWVFKTFRISISRQTLGRELISIVPLPAKCPELNLQENVWQFTRDNWLSNRVFTSYDDIVEHCCFAWNKLVQQPWKIMSIGSRTWALGF